MGSSTPLGEEGTRPGCGSVLGSAFPQGRTCLCPPRRAPSLHASCLLLAVTNREKPALICPDVSSNPPDGTFLRPKRSGCVGTLQRMSWELRPGVNPCCHPVLAPSWPCSALLCNLYLSSPCPPSHAFIMQRGFGVYIFALPRGASAQGISSGLRCALGPRGCSFH